MANENYPSNTPTGPGRNPGSDEPINSPSRPGGFNEPQNAPGKSGQTGRTDEPMNNPDRPGHADRPEKDPRSGRPEVPNSGPGSADSVRRGQDESNPGNPDWQSPPENPSQFPRQNPGQVPEPNAPASQPPSSQPPSRGGDLPREPKPAWVGDPVREEIEPRTQGGGTRPNSGASRDIPDASEETRPTDGGIPSNQPRD